MTEENNLWVEKQPDGTTKIGLSKAGQEVFGKVKFIDLPQIGVAIKTDSKLFDIEAEKAVQEVSSPLAGTIASVNTTLNNHPENLDKDDRAENWIVTIK